jgi:capsular polysaccharide biosynthesis protein
MYENGHRSARDRYEPSEGTIEVRQYVDALYRSRALIIGITLAFTAIVVLVSLSLSKTYEASAKLVLEPSIDSSTPLDATSTARELTTMGGLVTTPSLLDAAVSRLNGVSVHTLKSSVSTSVSPDSNLITVTGRSDSPAKAARIANVVSYQFLKAQQELQNARFADARAALLARLAQARSASRSADRVAPLNQALSDLSLRQAAAPTDLRLAEAAQPPSSPVSPRPLWNGVLAFFAAFTVSVLIALARYQISPRIGGVRELGRLMQLPVLAAIPRRPRRRSNRRRVAEVVERHTFDEVQAVVRLQVPPGHQRVILVTSPVEMDASERVARGLASALAQAGEPTLLVRCNPPPGWPASAEDGQTGFTDLLGLADAAGSAEIAPAIRRAVTRDEITEPYRGRGRLDILGDGHTDVSAAQLLSSDALTLFFQQLEQLDYSYVVLAAPPILNLPGGRVYAAWADGIIVATSLDPLKLEDVLDAREVFARLDAPAIGVVVVDATRVRGRPVAHAADPMVGQVPLLPLDPRLRSPN